MLRLIPFFHWHNSLIKLNKNCVIDLIEIGRRNNGFDKLYLNSVSYLLCWKRSRFWENCQTLIFIKKLQFLDYFNLFCCNFSFFCCWVNGLPKRQGFCFPVNACTGKGRTEEGGPPCIGKEEELALCFFCFFFRSVEKRYALSCRTATRPQWRQYCGRSLRSFYRIEARRRSISDLGRAPTSLSTSRPSLKSKRVGMLWIAYWEAVSGFSSTFSFPTFSLPAYSDASCSRRGEMIRQGPHQGAQQSNNTPPRWETTSSPKVLSVIGTGRSLKLPIERGVWHFPQRGLSCNRFLGSLFFVPQFPHRIMKFSWFINSP